MKAPTISICIPTHGRPGLLKDALRSAAGQSLPPDEILVSDDAGSRGVREMVEAFQSSHDVSVRYVDSPQLGSQADNVNSCFENASSDLTLLLHDDDLLLPDALKILRQPFVDYPGIVASYGKQIMIGHDGREMPKETEKLNEVYHRTEATAGLRAGILSGLLRQFPNDGYLVRTEVARRVRSDPKCGAACDVDFGIRCGEAGDHYFVNEFTAKYRLSADSVGRGAGEDSDDCGFFAVKIFSNLLTRSPEYRSQIEEILRRELPLGIKHALKKGDWLQAFRWYFSRFHRKAIFTPGGLKRGFLLSVKAPTFVWRRTRELFA